MSEWDGCAQHSDQVFCNPFWFPVHAGLDPHLMTARRGRRSAAAAVERDLKRTRHRANGQQRTFDPEPIPAITSRVESVSPSPQGVSGTVIPASSSHRQGAEARKVMQTRSGKRKIRDSEAGCDRVEAVAHLGSPTYHQSDMSSDDLFGEDEIESVRPGHVEALGAACVSFESEGGVTGAAAFGTKRGRMPSAKIAIARLYGWSSSGGFAEPTCLEAKPGRGQLRIIEDLVGGLHGGIVHFCATDAKVCKVGWPGRRVYHFYIWRPITIAGVGGTAQKGVKNHEVVSVAPPVAQANILDEGVDSPGPGPQPRFRKTHGAPVEA